MRFIVLLAIVACSGPISPPIGSRSARSQGGVMRPPPNAPPDPLGTVRPGDRSCTEDRDCRAGERCYPPDYTPPAAAVSSLPTTASTLPAAAASPGAPSAGPTSVPVP